MSNTVSVLWEPGTGLPARPLGFTLGFCLVCCPYLWVVHSSFPSQFVVHVSGLFILHFPLSLLSMSLGCSFFISLSVWCPYLWVVHSSFPSQLSLTLVFSIQQYFLFITFCSYLHTARKIIA